MPPPGSPEWFRLVQGPPLPGLPGHRSSDPPPETIHEIERLATQLGRSWHQTPELEVLLLHNGVSIAEVIEYRTATGLLSTLARLVSPGLQETYPVRPDPATE